MTIAHQLWLHGSMHRSYLDDWLAPPCLQHCICMWDVRSLRFTVLLRAGRWQRLHLCEMHAHLEGSRCRQRFSWDCLWGKSFQEYLDNNCMMDCPSSVLNVHVHQVHCFLHWNPKSTQWSKAVRIYSQMHDSNNSFFSSNHFDVSNQCVYTCATSLSNHPYHRIAMRHRIYLDQSWTST